MDYHLPVTSNSLTVVNGSNISAAGKICSQQYYHTVANGFHGRSGTHTFPMNQVPNDVANPNWQQNFAGSLNRTWLSDRKRSFDAFNQNQYGQDGCKRKRSSLDLENAFDAMIPNCYLEQHANDINATVDFSASTSNVDNESPMETNGCKGFDGVGRSIGAAAMSCGYHDLYICNSMIAEMHGC